MLCLVLLVSVLTAQCRGDGDNSSLSPMLLLPPVPASRHMSAAQVHALRRQLMRDNYDYHSADEGQPNITARNDGNTKFYYQKDGTDHLPRVLELAQANGNEFSPENGQQEHNKPRDQSHQYKQNGEYEHRDQHEQHEQRRHHNQPGEYERRGQYEQPGEHEHRGQYQQPDEHQQHGQNDQQDQYEQHGSQKQREQVKHHKKHQQREQRKQRGQNEHSEKQEQLEHFYEQEQVQSLQQKPRAALSLDDVPVTPPVAVASTDELTVRDVFKRDYTPDRRDIEPDQTKEYNPTFYNKRRDEYDHPYPAQMQRRPFSDFRGKHKEQHGQNDEGNYMKAQELARNAQNSSDEDYASDEQEAFDQKDASGSKDNEGSDFSLKSRSGRRQDERRILEERGPRGVAIMSLDHAPLPAFRLPRARRQYMHAPHHLRRHERA